MDEKNFDAESSRLQIKKLKEKVKSLVSEVDLSREIRSDDFPKTSKLQLERDTGDNSSESETIDEDGDEFLDINESEFMNEANWLIDWNSNCNISGEPSSDLFSVLYSEVEEFDADIADLYCELKILRKSSVPSFESKGSNTRNALIDSRTFTRPKKYVSRPPLTSIISNSGDDARRGKLQRRLTSNTSPTPNMMNKFEEVSRHSNRGVSGIYGESNWEEISQEGLADIENSSVKSQRKTLPASIIDRLQELKRSNNSYFSSRTPEMGRHLNVVNGNVDDSDKMNVAEDARKVKAAFDLNVKNALSISCGSDIFRNIPEYFSDDNESFFSLDEVNGFCDPSNYSNIVKEMEQNELRFYNSANPPEESLSRRMTFGGQEIPLINDGKNVELKETQELLLDIGGKSNKSDELLYESASRGNATFEVKNRENHKESNINSSFDVDKKSSLVDVIMQSDIIKNLSPNYNYKYCDNRNGNGGDRDRIANNVSENLNETYTKNELNKIHSEKYTTKIFDASFKKSSPLDKANGKKDSDQSEDDCMSTTSDNSYRSVDSNSELKNIEELKNIALQQNRKLADMKFSTPKLQGSKVSNTRNSDEWRNVSPIRRDIMLDGESQGSSNASSRGPSPRAASLPSSTDTSRKVVRPAPMRQPPKVPQRELKLKPTNIRPSQNFKKPVNSIKPSTEPVMAPKNDCKASASAAGMPALKQSVTPLSAVSSANITRPVTRIPSGIPRPPSRLKPPQIRASEVFKK